MPVEFGVLGPIAAWAGEERPREGAAREPTSRRGGAQRAGEGGDERPGAGHGGAARAGAARDERRIALKGPRQRAVLARLILARGEVVSVDRIVDDLWAEAPPRATGAIRTFVGDLRRALEPERPPRTPARLIVTEGAGYALHTPPESVDAWRFEHAVSAAATLPAKAALERITQALGEWRGAAYAELADAHWTRAERSRLTELRLHAVERRAEARIALGQAAEAVAELDAHTVQHPWREDAWRLLALALYRSGRQADALEVLRRARTQLIEHLGIDPGPPLKRLERDILHQESHLSTTVEQVWADTAAAYDRTVATGARARLESTVGLLRDLAVTGGGGLEAARRQRLAAVTAAEELGDPELTARVIGAYDVPAIWTRSDDPEQAAAIVAAAERALPHTTHDAARARLQATIALESRGTSDRSAEAEEAERIARRLDDPTLLAFALNGVFMQSFATTGSAPRRDAIGQELIAHSRRHGLVTYEVLGHLIAIQARSALADFAAAGTHADAADELRARYELPLIGVFTAFYRAMKQATHEAYEAAATSLDGAGMPGLEHGLLPLALLSLGHHGDADYGPYEPWARPHVLLAGSRTHEAAHAVRNLPDPPRDLLQEALWCLAARAAIAVGDLHVMRRAEAHLAPAANELAAGSGLLTLGPVRDHLDALAQRTNSRSTSL